ncbi:MAG: polyprenyl synthetase family protein [Phycisphaerales bacterium]|nr:MAG: polyprenyl synthetase family protein [Phycisphaerales bacterium]
MSNITLPLSELYAPIADEMRMVQTRFDAELDSDQAFVEDLLDRVRHFRGKMLRPALLLLTGKACGRLTDDHVTLAAVVEMVHVATLVHDDVLDGADMRRRSPTINAIVGNVQAVLLGDFLISHAFHLCSSLDSQYASRLIGATTNTVCEGELMQNHHRGDASMSEALYLDIIGRKTASLTAAACQLGARFAGADDATTSAARRFGYAAGLAFQIVDDVLDVVGAPDQMGKSLGRDFDLGKPTLPVLHCLAHCALDVRFELQSALSQQPGSVNGQLKAWLASTDSVSYAMDYANQRVADAVEALSALPPGDARSSLSAMAEFVTHRRW